MRQRNLSITQRALIRLFGAALGRSLIERLEADPELWRGAAPGQLSLGLGGASTAPINSTEAHSFEPTGVRVQRLSGAGSRQTVASFLAHYHYLESPGFPGPKFQMLPQAGTDTLGICTFGRIANPNWTRSAFTCESGDEDRTGFNHMVRESEYLELNRLALVPDEICELGTGAASWLASQATRYFDRRNRLLWRARAKETLGFALEARETAILKDARLGCGRKGTGFVKTLVSFADPLLGHQGTVYQAMGWRYGGQQPSVRTVVGQRSGVRISNRRIQKARNPSESGHATSALRLLWEGARGNIRLPSGDTLALGWLDRISGPGVDRKIQSGLRNALREISVDPGSSLHATVDYSGLPRIHAPGKHRYFRFLGSDHWGREIARRCTAVRDQILREDRAWHSRGWGPRTDMRHQFYPQRP